MGTLESRHGRTFDAFADHGDYITPETYTRQGRILAELRGQGADSPPITELTSELGRMWEIFADAADVDKDGRIDRDEYLVYAAAMTAFAQNLGSEEGWPLDPYLHRLFDVIDADSDGRITVEEFTAWLASLGMAADTDIEGAFANCDVDGNGTISLDEFSECGRNYWSKEDMSVRGARWIGP